MKRPAPAYVQPRTDAHERARIVAWLRHCAPYAGDGRTQCDELARMIDRGDHWRELPLVADTMPLSDAGFREQAWFDHLIKTNRITSTTLRGAVEYSPSEDSLIIIVEGHARMFKVER